MEFTNSFENRKHRLFESLAQAETKSIADGSSLEQVPYEKEDVIHSFSKKNKLNIIKRTSKESLFKRPNLPIGKCLPSKRQPDYQKNPHKWKKYSLEDVNTTEGVNTAAAFEFLNKIEEEKRNQRLEDISDDQDIQEPNMIPFISKRRVGFNKTAKKLKSIAIAEITEEAAEPRVKTKSSKKDTKVKLDHLFDE